MLDNYMTDYQFIYPALDGKLLNELQEDVFDTAGEILQERLVGNRHVLVRSLKNEDLGFFGQVNGDGWNTLCDVTMWDDDQVIVIHGIHIPYQENQKYGQVFMKGLRITAGHLTSEFTTDTLFAAYQQLVEQTPDGQLADTRPIGVLKMPIILTDARLKIEAFVPPGTGPFTALFQGAIAKERGR